jgi:hypothetical protein
MAQVGPLRERPVRDDLALISPLTAVGYIGSALSVLYFESAIIVLYFEQNTTFFVSLFQVRKVFCSSLQSLSQSSVFAHGSL